MSHPVYEHLSGPASACRLSVVVPCYNEQEGLDELHRRTSLACQGVFGDSYEIILVDDGSQDGSWSVIHRLTQKDSHVVGIKLSRNYGHQLALSAGLTFVRGDLVLVIDDDLQDPPELLGPMIKVMEENDADVVYGQRKTRPGETFFKTNSARIFYRILAKATDLHIPLDTGDFRLMSRRVADIISRMPERDRFIRGMVAWLGFTQVPFMYDRDARFTGETKYTMKKLIRLAIDAMVSFSILPLRISTFVGLSLAGMFALTGGYAVLSWLLSGTPPGWASLTLLVVGGSAAQLLALGVIGEYVGRIYFQTKQRPLFLVAAVEQSRPTDTMVAKTTAAESVR